MRRQDIIGSLLLEVTAVVCGKVRVAAEKDPQEKAAKREKSHDQPCLAGRKVAESLRHLPAITSSADQ